MTWLPINKEHHFSKSSYIETTNVLWWLLWLPYFPSHIWNYNRKQGWLQKRERLYFLNRFTAGKAHDITKGFVTVNSENHYKDDRDLLAKRFGDSFHVAQAYQKKWPQGSEGDGLGRNELLDYLIRCRDSMKTMRSLDKLHSTQTFLHISSKLPSYSGQVLLMHNPVQLCRAADAFHAFI